MYILLFLDAIYNFSYDGDIFHNPEDLQGGEALTVAIIPGVILDFIMTFMNMFAIPADLAATAKKAKIINYDVLRCDTPKKNRR